MKKEQRYVPPSYIPVGSLEDIEREVQANIAQHIERVVCDVQALIARGSVDASHMSVDHVFMLATQAPAPHHTRLHITRQDVEAWFIQHGRDE